MSTIPAGPGRLLSFGYAFASILSCANAFYLPGSAPHDFVEGEQVPLFVNTLTPMLAGNDNAKLVRTWTVIFDVVVHAHDIYWLDVVAEIVD